MDEPAPTSVVPSSRIVVPVAPATLMKLDVYDEGTTKF